MMVGSGCDCDCWKEVVGGSFLEARRRVVSVSWRWETRVKGVMLGRWRCARRMLSVVVVVAIVRLGSICKDDI